MGRNSGKRWWEKIIPPPSAADSEPTSKKATAKAKSPWLPKSPNWWDSGYEYDYTPRSSYGFFGSQYQMVDLVPRLNTLLHTIADDPTLGIVIGDEQKKGGSKRVAVADPNALRKVGFSADEAVDTAVVNTVHKGAHRKAETNHGLIKHVQQRLQSRGANPKLIDFCLNAAEDLRVDACLERGRPGYGGMRRGAAKANAKWAYKPKGDLVEDTIRAAAGRIFADVDLTKCESFSNESPPISDPRWGHVDSEKTKLLAELMAPATAAKNTAQALRIGHRAFRKVFGFDDPPPEKPEGDAGQGQEGDDDQGQEGEQGGGDSSKGDERDEKRRIQREANYALADYSPTAMEKNEEESAGGSGATEHTITAVLDFSKRRALRSASEYVKEHEFDLKAKVADLERFLKERYERPPELVAADKVAATKNHAGCQAWYNKAEHDEEMKRSDMFKKYAADLRRKLVSPRRELATTIRDALRRAKQTDSNRFRSGVRVAPEKVWRVLRLHDYKVMRRNEYKAPGGWHVDIWIDASGSNLRFQEIACQTLWVLAGALRDAGIRCRVYSWCSGDNFDAIRRHITSDDDDLDSVFTYRADGNNRDGHLLGVASELLGNVQETNKMLVWISDGYPASNSGSIIAASGGLVDYDVEKGAKDTGEILRNVRKRFPVLGVLFKHRDGGRGYLESCKEIYGKDFAAIPYGEETFRAVPKIIGAYLTRLIAQNDD